MQQRGFTLIELIIVIVILGILAVTAAPRFIDLGSDARTSTMQGVLGAVKSSAQLARASILLNPNGTVALEGVAVQTDTDSDGAFTSSGDVQAANGYPHAEDVCDLVGLTNTSGLAAELGTDNTGDSISCSISGTTLVIQDDNATTPANCSVSYTEATSGGAPVIVSDTSGC